MSCDELTLTGDDLWSCPLCGSDLEDDGRVWCCTDCLTRGTIETAPAGADELSDAMKPRRAVGTS